MPGRRPLSFASLDEIMPDVERLLAGHSTVGKWSLGQICNHLAGTIRCSIEGFNARAPWIIRKTLGACVRPIVFRTGTMREGIKVPEAFLPRPGLDARAEAEALRATIALFQRSAGPFVEHPFFGKLSDDEWRKLHCIHSAHHLSFAIPSS